MKDIKVPGVLWVVLIVAGIAVVRQFVPEPLYVELAVVIGFVILKSLNLGTDEINDLIDIIERLQGRLENEPMAMPKTVAERAGTVPQVERPNKAVRFLLG